MWRNLFSYNFLKTWTHPQVVFKDFVYFLGISFLRNTFQWVLPDIKESTRNLKNNTKQIKMLRYKINYKTFWRMPKNVSIMHLSEINLTSVIRDKDYLLYVGSCILIIVSLPNTRNIRFTGAAIENVLLIKNIEKYLWKNILLATL